MHHSTDVKWKAVALVYVYNHSIPNVCALLRVSNKSVRRWYKLFEETGSVEEVTLPRPPRVEWPVLVNDYIKHFVQETPCYYLEELENCLKHAFPEIHNFSVSTLCQ